MLVRSRGVCLALSVTVGVLGCATPHVGYAPPSAATETERKACDEFARQSMANLALGQKPESSASPPITTGTPTGAQAATTVVKDAPGPQARTSAETTPAPGPPVAGRPLDANDVAWTAGFIVALPVLVTMFVAGLPFGSWRAFSSREKEARAELETRRYAILMDACVRAAVLERTSGPRHPDFAQALVTLGSQSYRYERFGEAEALYLRALTIQEDALGGEHLQVADTLTAYAGLLLRTGRTAEAEEVIARARAIRVKAETQPGEGT